MVISYPRKSFLKQCGGRKDKKQMWRRVTFTRRYPISANPWEMTNRTHSISRPFAVRGSDLLLLSRKSPGRFLRLYRDPRTPPSNHLKSNHIALSQHTSVIL